MGTHRLTSQTIDDEAALRELLGAPSPIVCAKVTNRLNPLTRQFIERSPFLCLSTADEHGNCDVSPRGDPAGFVRSLDDVTLLALVPDVPAEQIFEPHTPPLEHRVRSRRSGRSAVDRASSVARGGKVAASRLHPALSSGHPPAIVCLDWDKMPGRATWGPRPGVGTGRLLRREAP